MDRRLTPSDGKVAARDLRAKLDGEPRQVNTTCTAIWGDTNRRSVERQLIYGDLFTVLDNDGDLSFGRAGKDNYAGYVNSADLGKQTEPSHAVCTLATHLYPEPSLKVPAELLLSFGSLLRIIGETGSFAETSDGFFVPKSHLREISKPMSDPVSIATLFLGTPYLWGGNSCNGIDCSGLVQTSFHACGYPCDGDSDLQEKSVGTPLADHQKLQRNDLIFWKGHVAMVLDEEIMIHATAHFMAVVFEPIEKAISRIYAQGGGPVTSRKRP